MSSSSLLHSFAPIIGPEPRLLVLGSMPGKASLDAAQYYAHPRNAFWPIMSELLNFDQREAYPQRCKRLVESKIAVWDVLQSCFREGSLDAGIKAEGLATNDFTGLFEAHPSLERVLLNGATAHKLYQQRVWRELKPEHQAIPYFRLPSTSPAYARMNLSQKMQQWCPHLLVDHS